MLLQVLPQGLAQDSHAAAMDYAHAGESCQERAVDELLDFAGSVVHSSADHIDLGRGARALLFQGHRKAARPRSRDWRISGANHDFGDVIARDFHFHDADFDFEMIRVNAPHDSRRTSYRLELDR